MTLAAATVLLGASTATPASAGSAQAEEIHFEMKTNDGDPGGAVHFWPAGDRVAVCDIQHNDDAYVHVSIINVTKDPNVVEYSMEDGGDLDCNSHNGYEGQPYQLAEGHCFGFQIWLEKSSNPNVIMPGTYDTAQWRNYNHAKKECPGVD